MKKVIKYLVLITNFIVFYFLLIRNNWLIYNMTYLKTIIFILSTCIFVYISGIAIDKEKDYKINVYCYIFLFLMLLYSFVFIIGRPMSFHKDFNFYMQLKPFYTILTIMKYGTTTDIVKNILGNIIALIPLSFLLMIRSEKLNNIIRQSIIIIPLIIFIEFYQGYSNVGSFDIDDIILNYFGVIIFTFLITRFDLIGKTRKVFYSDFGLKSKIKNVIFYLSLSLIIIIDVLCFLIK